jgi:amino-acid N-acetyltransferase
MNVELATQAPPERARARRRSRAVRRTVVVTYRAATSDEAGTMHELIARHLEEGHLLPRQLDELALHAPRFVVAVVSTGDGRRGAGHDEIVGCAELAPLSERVAEIRSLVVHGPARGAGIGRGLVDALQRRARQAGFEELCAFTHDAGYFARLGFEIVPHAWLPEKIARDCHSCHLFRRCGQHAVVLPLMATASGSRRQPHRRGATG